MRIYCGHAISGARSKDVFGYYEDLVPRLESYGFEVLHPMVGKGYLRTETEFKSHGYGTPVSSNHAIYNRDRWMIRRADVAMLDLRRATHVSIGCVMELAIASELGKHTIVVMEEYNIHQHAFVLEAADLIFPTLDEAESYLLKLIKGDFD